MELIVCRANQWPGGAWHSAMAAIVKERADTYEGDPNVVLAIIASQYREAFLDAARPAGCA